MPWNETSPMHERRRFIADYHRGLFPMTELCEIFGISRKTGYKWLERFEAEGRSGLQDRSRRPRRSPLETPSDVVEALLAARRRHPLELKLGERELSARRAVHRTRGD
jgi:putative transposase